MPFRKNWFTDNYNYFIKLLAFLQNSLFINYIGGIFGKSI